MVNWKSLPEKERENILPDEFSTMRELQKDLLCSTNAIKTVKNFVDVRNR